MFSENKIAPSYERRVCHPSKETKSEKNVAIQLDQVKRKMFTEIFFLKATTKTCLLSLKIPVTTKLVYYILKETKS